MSINALVRRPSPKLAAGLLTHLDRVPVDADLAVRQWAGYVQALADAGWGIIEVPATDEYPDGVFVEDTAVMFGATAVITNPGAPERAGETETTAAVLRGLGYRIKPMSTGHLDGGDVLKIDHTVYVGRGGRTDAAGVAELRSLVEPLGYTVIAVPVSKVLHLKSAITALPDGTIVGHPDTVDDPAFFPHFRAMPEEAGGHVVDLGLGRVLMAASAPRSAELFADLGFTPVVVDISEFEKLEGCVTCLSVRLRQEPQQLY